MVLQHRRHVRQRGVGHEQKSEDRPKNRVEGGAEPVGEDRDHDDHEAGKEDRENRNQAGHAFFMALCPSSALACDLLSEYVPSLSMTIFEAISFRSATT